MIFFFDQQKVLEDRIAELEDALVRLQERVNQVSIISFSFYFYYLFHCNGQNRAASCHSFLT